MPCTNQIRYDPYDQIGLESQLTARDPIETLRSCANAFGRPADGIKLASSTRLIRFSFDSIHQSRYITVYWQFASNAVIEIRTHIAHVVRVSNLITY